MESWYAEITDETFLTLREDIMLRIHASVEEDTLPSV